MAPGVEAQDDVAITRRVAAMSGVALEEYALGVQDGRIVSRAELDEAEMFLAEARRRTADLSPRVAAMVVPALEGLLVGVKARRDVDSLRADLAQVRRTLESELGTSLDPLPAVAPSLARAARVYALRCAECHGDAGRGDGIKAARLDPPPADFTSPDLRSTSPLDFFRIITVGISGTEMREWETLVPLEERWGLAMYAAAFRYSDGERARGAGVVRGCPACVALASDLGETAAANDDSLATLLSAALPRLDSTDLRAAVAFARTAPAIEGLGGDRTVEMARVLGKTAAGVDAAAALATRGEREGAANGALDAYLVFERVEAGLRARDGRVAARVERAFADFRSALSAGTSAEIDAARRRVHEGLAETRATLERETGPRLLLGQSFVIMVREGLEAILIIGALIAFLGKAGAPERKRDIAVGAGAALLASLATAGVLVTFFRQSMVQQELLEGIVMLVAAAVLFSVSYWLVSKIEVRKWHAFVSGQVSRALSKRSALALAAVAFLAVYREGFETVLFYAALFASAGSSVSHQASLVSGMVGGAVVLGAVYYVMQRWGVRLPLKHFFAITSALLYVMAFSFAGQGIAELQTAGALPATPIAWMPSIPALGIFPTAQTLAIQLTLAAAVAGALIWVFWASPALRDGLGRGGT